MHYWIYFMLGAVVGIAWTLLILGLKFKHIGTLNIDHSDEQPLLFLELNKGESPYTIAQKKMVIMDVKRKNYITRD